jgi:hypothetical protein
MLKARGQAERYIRALPPSDPNPPFMLVVDVGNSIEVFADFTQAGRSYLAFPHPLAFRLRVGALGRARGGPARDEALDVPARHEGLL